MIVTKLHGEGGAVTTEQVKFTRHATKELLLQFTADCIYNADETGLFYDQFMGKQIISKSKKSTARGNKQSKKRITALFCCNADGSDKYKLLLINLSLNPPTRGKHSPSNC